MHNRISDNGSEGVPDKINGAEMSQAPQKEKIPAGPETWTAVQMHELRAENVELQAKLLEKDQIILAKEQAILALRQKLHVQQSKNLDDVRKKADELNAKLREDYDITVGRTLHRDDKTGEIYWLVDKTEE